VSYVLVTNDDGVDSPALLPLVRALGSFVPVRVVVPRQERSWISKAISRWDEIRVGRLLREGVEIFVVDGFPADCTNLGVHSLFAERPDMVVAGINIGLNSGLGFFLSSGTVGAAAEGWVAGLPALAFSVGIWGKDRDWKQRALRGEVDGLWDQAAALCADIVRVVRERGFPPEADLLNVNLPVGAGPDTERVVTRIAAAGYDRLFRLKGDGVYVHDYAGHVTRTGDLRGTDIEALKQGRVSITPIRLAHYAELDPGISRGLTERSRR
jgi:5'-nucleotidase